MINKEKQDKIYNALSVGMDLSDAYIYAGLTEEEIVRVNDDEALQLQWRSIIKGFEYSLLSQLHDIVNIQTRVGREAAVTWSLEHLYPRYSNKPQPDTGEVHIHFNDKDPSDYDTVEVFKPVTDDGSK